MIFLVREEPVLSGSLAVRKVGGKWQEECWVRITFGIEEITWLQLQTFCIEGSTDGLEAESVEQCGTI